MLALLEPIVSRPLRDQSRLLSGDLSSIFGIELIEQAPRASLDLDAFMERVARKPAHSAPVHAPAPAPAPAPVASRVEPSQGSAEDPRDVSAAIAAWKALPDGAQVTCARGHKWTAKRSGGRLTFRKIKPSGRAGHVVERPWFPLIAARLPVWPVPLGGSTDPQQGAPAAPAPASARTSSASCTRWNAQEDDELRREWGVLPLDEIAERHRRTGNGIWCRARTLALAEPAGGWDSRDAKRPAPLAPLGSLPAKNQPASPRAPLTIRPAKVQPTIPAWLEKRRPAKVQPTIPATAPVASRVEPSQGSAEAPRDVPAAVAAWKALPDGAQVTCARGHKWTAKRSGGRLTFGQIKPSGRAGDDVEQPWYPLILARLPVLPVPIIGEPDPQQGAPAAPVHAPLTALERWAVALDKAGAPH
jgi:hypothetical protein